MDWIAILGFCAATLTAGASLPQAIKTIRTKRAKDLSLLMYAMAVVGSTVWVLYGIIRQDMPVAAASIIALCFNIPVLILKIKYK